MSNFEGKAPYTAQEFLGGMIDDESAGSGFTTARTPRSEDRKQLTLGELEPLTSTLLAILLALVFPRIASEEASLLQAGTKLTVELD